MENECARPGWSPIHIRNLEDFRAREHEIVERLNSLPNGGRLLLLHPLRCLRDVGVSLEEEALQEWERVANLSFARHTGLESAYNGIAASSGPTTVRIRVGRLLPEGHEKRERP